MTPPKRFGISSRECRGIAKLIEECGEVVQDAAKLIATGGTFEYDDGTKVDRDKLWTEVGDLLAAIHYAIEANPDILPVDKIVERKRNKIAKYRHWFKTEAR